MRVDIALAVTQFLAERGWRIAQVQRHGVLRVFARGPHRSVDRAHNGVALRRSGEIDDRLGERKAAFGHAEELHGLQRGDCDLQRHRVREPNILRGHRNDATRDRHCVAARFRETSKPVDRRLHVGVAQALVQRGQQVVVQVAVLVVPQRAVLERLGDHLLRDHVAIDARSSAGLERRQRTPRVAAAEHGNARLRIRLNREFAHAESAFSIRQRAIDHRADRVLRQRLQRDHATSRQQRGVDRERRVLCRCTDQHEQAVLDVRQERVLLRLVEAMDLVDEHKRALPGARPSRFGGRDRIANLRDAGQHCGERLKRETRMLRDQLRKRRLAGARRAPQQKRPSLAALDRATQRATFANDLLLTEILLQRLRPHAFGERHVA